MNKKSALRLVGLPLDAPLKCFPYYEVDLSVHESKDDNILGVIFTPDPVTGFPSSDFTSNLNFVFIIYIYYLI